MRRGPYGKSAEVFRAIYQGARQLSQMLPILDSSCHTNHYCHGKSTSFKCMGFQPSTLKLEKLLTQIRERSPNVVHGISLIQRTEEKKRFRRAR